MSRLLRSHWVTTVLVGFSVSLAGRSAHALSFTVSTTDDSHDRTLGDSKCNDSNKKCSLRAAIEEANWLNAGVLITVPAGIYIVKSVAGFGELKITAPVTIAGAGAPTTIIDARGNCRVMHVVNTGMALSGVSLRNGNGQIDEVTTFPENPGGELYIEGQLASVTATHDVFTTNTLVSPLPFPGGGIAVGGSLYLQDSTVSDNSTKADLGGGTQHSGGGIYGFEFSSTRIFYSTISNNVSVRGGGIGMGGGYLLLSNSTISGNRSTFEGGGGLFIGGNFGADVMYSTITNNSIVSPGGFTDLVFGGGIRVSGSLNLGKCIISGNSDNRLPTDPNYSPDIGQDSTSQIQSFDDNLIGIVGSHLGNYIGFDGDAYDWFGNGSVSLGPLANNGGETLTHFLIAGEPIDAYTGDGGAARFGAPNDDQTHFPRVDGLADSGSFED